MRLGWTCSGLHGRVDVVGFAACLAPVVPVADGRQVARIVGPAGRCVDDVIDVGRTITTTCAVLHH